ncbi:hypothetical protein ACRCUN_01905 [Mycobacterium sp. LTG2003]
MTFTNGRKALARVAVAAVSGFAAVALAVPSTAESWTRGIAIEPCERPWTQMCTTVPTWDADVQERMKIQVTADPTHCSDIIAHVLVDDREVMSERLGPGDSTTPYEMPFGHHTIGVQAEGVDGGCNDGYLAAWGGTLRVWTLGAPQIIDRG